MGGLARVRGDRRLRVCITAMIASCSHIRQKNREGEH